MARRARSSKTKGAKPKKKGQGASKEVDKEMKKEISNAEGKSPKEDLPSKKSTEKETKVKDTQKKEAPGRSGLREWFEQNKYTIFILLGIFVFAFLLREYFYYQISFDTWPPNIVGNDPSYHKRVIDFVQSDHHHITIDPLLNYPISGGNPRPPIFDWSIAVMGIILSPLFGFNVENSTWFVFQFAPTFWGALTVFPMYMLGKEVFGKKAGIMAALFLALTASHIERSTLGFTDHDSFVVFFVVLTMYFLSRSFSVQSDKNYISDWKRPDSVLLGLRSFIMENKLALGFAFLTGLSISTIALTWQGYAYMMAILLIYYLVQLLLHRFRNEDPLGTFLVIFITMGTVIVLSFPYYFVMSVAVWSQGFYIFLAVVVLGAFIVPTRDIPWLLVIPTLALFLGSSYFILQVGFPDTANLLFTGGGYFGTNKLYSTIAEAQAPDVSRVVTTYGPATFFLGLIGVVMAVIKIPKQMKKDYIVIVIWTIVAIYMALSAIRFNFNATPAFALLAGWVVVKIVEKFKAEGLSIVYSIIAVLILVLGLVIVAEEWEGFFVRNYILLTVFPVVGLSLAYFAYMKYRKKRDYFKFRKIMTALGVGFVVMLPNVFYAVDAAIPIESKGDFDPELRYLGSFGSSLHSEYWMDSYEWLAQQDILMDNETVPPEDRPAFMSWWDYGFDQLLLGKHPTAADNFQNGYQFTGSMIASQNESEAIALMTIRLLEGDWASNKGKFSPESWEVLVKYLGDDKNSTLSAPEIQRIFKNPGKYRDIVSNNPDKYGPYKGITNPNAKYAAARGAMMHLGEENLVNLYHDIRGTTGKSLRYFAVDYRLFPFSASNTGIFYAPITLADRNVEDYLEYKVYAQENTRGSNDDPQWEDYPDNPITMEKAREESERLGYKFRIVDTDMYYTDMFYHSLFYRTYVGYAPEDVGSPNDGKSVPGMFDSLQSLPAMQAWNMTHWKLVYRTLYYSEKDEANSSFPDDYEPMSSKKALDLYYEQGGDVKSGLGQGVFYIMYYDGAIVSGKVRTERGVGVPDVRVTVLDDYGIPHGNVLTGPEGEYSLIVPPGEVQLVVTEGPLENQYDKLYQFQVDQSTGQPTSLLNNTKLMISDKLAMREVNGGRKYLDLLVPGHTLSGKLYWDLNEDSKYTEKDDEPLTEGEVTFELRGSDGHSYGPYELDETGSYKFEDLVPGKYDIVYANDDVEETLIEEYKVELSGEATKDIRIDNSMVSGHVKLFNDRPLPNQTVRIMDQGGNVMDMVTDVFGNYTTDRLFPGIYTMDIMSEGFWHDNIKFKIGQGDNLSINVTLHPEGGINIRALYPYTTQEGAANGGPAVGAVADLVQRSNGSRKWSFFLDQKGEFEASLPIGTYDIIVHSVEKDTNWAYLDTLEIEWKEEYKDSILLEPAFRVNGVVTKLAASPINMTQVRFDRIGDDSVAVFWTNQIGYYSGLLPRADYKVVVINTTAPGNVTYIHLQDISAPATGNKLDLNIRADKTAVVKGRVYWDKDGNRNYSAPEYVINEGLGDVPAEVGLEDIRVTFTYGNGTLDTITGIDGLFEINLPPNEYMMEVEIDGFYHFAREVVVENTPSVMNFGLNDTDAQLEAKSRQVELRFFWEYYGKNEVAQVPLEDFKINVIAMEPHLTDETTTIRTDADGISTLLLPPGEYSIEMVSELEMEGLQHLFQVNEPLMVEPSTSLLASDMIVDHTVTYRGQLFFEENSIVRYPPETVVNFNAIQGMRVTIVSDITDFNGNFEVEAPSGDFVLEAHLERPGTHYMVWQVVSLDMGSSPGTFQMTQALPVEGSVTPEFDGIRDSELFFETDGLWKASGLDEDGSYFVILFPGEYTVRYNFATVDSKLGEDVGVEYYLETGVTVEGATYDLDLALNKIVEVRGAVYDDQNGDRTIDPEERRSGINVTFTPEDGGDPIWVISDDNGDYRISVPYTRLSITVDGEGYKETPRDDVSVLDLPEESYALWDIPLIPENIPLEGILFHDKDGDGEIDDNEKGIPGMELVLEPMDGEALIIITGPGGIFKADLLPDIYNVKGMRYTNGLPDFGYLAELNVNLGDDLSDQVWPGVQARRLTGTVFYKDTNGKIHFTPQYDQPITFTADQGGAFEIPHSDGTYSIDLPYYEYYISSRIDTGEYGMEMTYRINKELMVNESTSEYDLALEFEKDEDYSFEIDLVKDYQHEMEMSPSETIYLQYFIRNAGNEPITVTVASKEKPDGWIVEFPEGADIEIPINGEVLRTLNITSPNSPAFTNSLIFEGSTTEGTRNTFQVQVDTPPNYRFDFELDIPDVLGVDYDEMRVFNLTVNNMGNGEDVVNIHLSPDIQTLEDWRVEWEGELEFPEEGVNASLTPNGVRRYAVTVFTPEGGNNSFYNEELTLTFTGSNRIGDTLSKSVRIEVRRPNLVLPSGYLKLANRRLTDPLMGGSLEANITVKSLYRDISNVNVSLRIDGKEVAFGYVPHIPQDGTGYTKLRINLSENNISKDDFHTFEVVVDPGNEIRETDDLDNGGVWQNVVVGDTPQAEAEINWRIVIFLLIVVVVAIGIIAYRERTQPI
ncbi:MAG: STT3 domain-containing protein [Thermoplasmatota archaeon]